MKISSAVQEIYPDIYKIQLPFPGDRPGPINVYLFRGECVTLIDTGIPGTVKYLKKALDQTGISFTDIKRIIITHGHVDHYGAAKKIVALSGGRAAVAAHHDDVKLIEEGEDIPVNISEGFLKLMGVPFIYRKSMRIFRHVFKLFAENSPVDEYLNEGDRIKIGNYTAAVISTPGHSRGSVCIYLEKENLLFAGDHILEHITPNALVMLDAGTILPERLSQAEYYNSLLKIEKLGNPVVYTGHGKDVHDLKKVIDFYRDQFRERQEKILSVPVSHSLTVYHIARRVFTDLSGLNILMQIYLSISEVYTHLQVLERDRRVFCKIENNRLTVRRPG